MKKLIAFVLIIVTVFAYGTVSTFAVSPTESSIFIKKGNDITVGSVYGSSQKLWLRFAPCGPNGLVQLYTISKSSVDSDAPETVWLSSGTDWVGPVMMKEKNADDSEAIYSGGWHNREDSSASAVLESVVVKLDGVIQEGNVTANGSVIEIIVTNKLFIGTTSQNSKDGMREIVHYTIYDNTIDVETELVALNDVEIVQYFGLQGVTRCYTADMIQFVNGQENSYVGGYYTHVSGTKADYPNVNAVVHCNEDGDKLTMTLDRAVGLGTLNYLSSSNHVATHSSLNKSYFNLVNGVDCVVNKDEKLEWKGQYKFEQLPVSSAVISDYNALTRESLLTISSSDATVSDNLTLPLKGSNGSTISWKSSNKEVISETGVVKTPNITQSVNLTATIFDGNGASMKKVFSFRVPGKDGPIDSSGMETKPEKDSFVRADSFEDGVIDENTITDVIGNVTEENGGLHLVRTSSDGDVGASVYLKSDKTLLHGNVLLEFTLSKKRIETGLAAYIFGENRQYFRISTLPNKQLTISYSDATGTGTSQTKTLTAQDVLEDTLRFSIFVDTAKGTFRIWLNDKFICAGNSIDASYGISHVGFLQGKASGTTTDVVIEDFSVYTAKTAGLVKYFDDFEDGVMTENISVTNHGATTVKEENGVLKVATSSSTNAPVIIYPDESRKAVTGKLSLESYISRDSCDHAFDFYINGSNGKNLLYCRLWGTSVYGYWADESGGDRATHSLSGALKDRMKVYIEVDTGTGQFECWVNGIYLGSGYSLGAEDILSVSVAPFDTSCNPAMEYFKYTDLTGDYEKSVGQYVDSFSGNTVSKNVIITNMEQNDSSLMVINREKASTVRINLKEDASEVKGDFSVEFTSKRDLTYATTDFHFYGKDGKRYTTIRWWSVRDAGYASVLHRVSTSSDETTVSYKTNSAIGSEKELRVKIVFHTEDSTFSVWINGYEIVKNVLSSHEADSVIYMQMENVYAANGSYAGTGYGNAALYDFAYYCQINGMGIADFVMDYNPYDKKVSVASPVDGKATVLVASYIGNQMVSVDWADVTLKKHDDVLADTSDLAVSGADHVVVYLWEGFSTLKPLCKSMVVDSIISAD